MAKIAAAALVVLVAATPVAFGATRKQRKTARTETREYAGTAGVHAGAAEVSACVQESGCLEFTTQSGEAYVTIAVADATGTSAPFAVNVQGSTSFYCGASDTPLWLNGAESFDVRVLGGSADCAGVGTTGSVAATFSNRP